MARGPQRRWLRPHWSQFGAVSPAALGTPPRGPKEAGDVSPDPTSPPKPPPGSPRPPAPSSPSRARRAGSGFSRFYSFAFRVFFWFCPKPRGASQDGGCSSSSDAREAGGGTFGVILTPGVEEKGWGGLGQKAKPPGAEAGTGALLGF